jgi:hypothetical protein
MLTFWQWLFIEGDQGFQAFIDQTNRQFRTWIGTLLQKGKFTDERNRHEAEAIVSVPSFFDYAQELITAARGGRAGLRGQDVLDGAQEANARLWLNLLNPTLYDAAGVTWETRNPFSAGRHGIRGTIRAWAKNVAGHFAARLQKRRTGVATRQFSQMSPDRPFDAPARGDESDVEWADLRGAIIADLERQLRREIESQGPHWQSRARQIQLAMEIVRRQMAIPWTWRSMPEIANEIPGLEGGLRGGLADALKKRIDAAKRKALGEARRYLLACLSEGCLPSR